MFPIATTTLSGSTSTLTFSSIPQTFTHLQLRMFAVSAYNDPRLQFNGDTGSNYSLHQLYGNGSTTSAAGYASLTYVSAGTNGASSTSYFSPYINDILDYTNTNKNKTVRNISGFDTNGTGNVIMQSSVWLNTAAITSITIFAASNFASGSTFQLYGITTA
jgi:hypothetical protein